MAFLNDFTIDFQAKTIRHTAGTTIYSVNLMYSTLQDLFDEPAQMDDLVPMSAQTPTEYAMINGWFIDDASTQFLRGGAITSNGWAGGIIRAISYDNTGAGVAFAPADIGKTIVGGTSLDTGVIVHFDERFGLETGVVWIRPTVVANDLFANVAEAFTVTGGVGVGSFTATLKDQNGVAITASLSGETVYGNANVIGTLVKNTEVYVIQPNDNFPTDKIAQFWDNATHTSAVTILDFVLKIQEFGILISGGRLNFLARQFNKLYDNFQTVQLVGKQFPIPLATADDLNNIQGNLQMTLGVTNDGFQAGDLIQDDTDATIKGVVTSYDPATNILQYYLVGSLVDFSAATGTFASVAPGTGTGTAVNSVAVNMATGIPATISVVHGAASQDIGDGGGVQPYSITVDLKNETMGSMYERLKFITRRGSTLLLDNQNGEQYLGNELRLPYTAQSGAFAEGLIVIGAVSGATGILVANHNAGATGDLILRNVVGTFQLSETINDAATGAATAGTAVPIPAVKASPIGTLAGGKFFGAPGVWLANFSAADAQNFQLIDDNGITRFPPNTVSVSVNSVSDLDMVGVYQTLGAGSTVLNKAQYNPAISALRDAVLVTNSGSINTNITPPSGVVRVVKNPGLASESEQRYRYLSFVSTTGVFTLDSITTANVADAGGSATRLIDLAGDFYGRGVAIGDVIENFTDNPGAFSLVTGIDNQTGDLTFALQPLNTETVVIGAKTYVFQTVLTDVDGNVHIGGTAAQSAQNLKDAINNQINGTDSGEGKGVGYASATTTNTDVSASEAAGVVTVLGLARRATGLVVGETLSAAGNVWDAQTITDANALSSRALTTLILVGGTSNDWAAGDVYNINVVSQVYAITDNMYTPIIEALIPPATALVNNTIIHAVDVDVVVRVRQGRVILPFQTTGTITTSGLTQGAIRTVDTIAN